MNQKERIICEAAAMFLEEGVKSVRMDDIAARVGISKRTLYEMFSDKSDLLGQSMSCYFEQKREEMEQRTKGAANIFEEIFLILDSMKLDDRRRLLIGNLKKFYPEIHRRVEEEAHRFSDCEFNRLLDRGVAQGLLLPDIDKGLALITLTYTMTALFDQKHFLSKHDGLSIQMAFEYVIVNFFRGLSTHKGIEVIDGLVDSYRKKQNKI
ncbi:MAG: TetR/AcrR family transcriptional regulator [Alistipes sp.]|jgi:AcrR family transcriptional regulator|nr:TetR/AcrR family transcriptional regulator [Alistipes sp.]